MRLSNRFYRKDMLLMYLIVICLFTFSILPNITYAQTTTVSVDPPSVTANPGESFTVNINIADVTDLAAWQIKLSWKWGLLELTSVTEGPFLQSGGTTYFVYTVYEIQAYVDMACAAMWIGTVSGSGVLATLNFTVVDTGECSLTLFDTKLVDAGGNEILHDTSNGHFYTTWPVASFTYTPDSYGRPIVGENVTFDASASYDPDGGNETYVSGIVSYEWDFGDNVTGTGMIITHGYDTAGNYNVTLTVTDNENETYNKTRDIAAKFHDIAIMKVEAPTKVLAGDMATIEVTVANNGSHTETYNVTAYYFDYTYYYPIKTETKRELQPEKVFVTQTLEWNTTGVAPGSYPIWAYAYLVDPANVAFRPGEEQNTTNNERFGGFVNVTLVAVHDINITGVTVTPTEVKVGQTVKINVHVENEGNVDDTFSVNVYNGTSLIGTQNTTLLKGEEKTLHFSWFTATNGTTVQSPYNISAQAPPITNPPPGTNETDVADNTFVNVTGTIRLLPVAYFTFSPSELILNQTVTFDASASYAPGTPTKTIDSYSWDFGDGTSDTGVTATHIYDASGSYSVELTVVDSDGLSDTLSQSVTVQKLNSTITVSASVTIVPVGSKGTVITGSISPVRAGANMSIYYVESGEETWISLANVTTNDNGQYDYLWMIWLKPGNYTVKASWPGDEVTLPAESSEITVKVIQKITSTIDISVSSTTITMGENIFINGSISPVRAGVNVTIWQMLGGSDWSPIATVTTDENGRYVHNWEPANSGTYVLKASWLGDEVTNADESDARVIVVAEVPAPAELNIFLYSTVGLGVALVVTLAYFLWVKKPKPT